MGTAQPPERHVDTKKEKNNMATCKVFAMFVFLPEEDANYACTKCKVTVLLEDRVERQEAHLATLRFIREGVGFLDKGKGCLKKTS